MKQIDIQKPENLVEVTDFNGKMRYYLERRSVHDLAMITDCPEDRVVSIFENPRELDTTELFELLYNIEILTTKNISAGILDLQEFLQDWIVDAQKFLEQHSDSLDKKVLDQLRNIQHFLDQDLERKLELLNGIGEENE
jgi:hypothetical protein